MKRIIITLTAWVFVAHAQGSLDTTAGWQYRIPITIQASMVDTDLDSFPFYFPLDSSLATFWGNINDNGSDLRITKADKVTLCYAQLDTFNFSSSDSVGELYWRGDASSTTDTKFYLYYGNSGASPNWSNQVWNEQYLAVHHYSENPANGSLQNWAGDGNNGTPQGSMNGLDLVDGINGIPSAWDFDGSDDNVILPDALNTGIGGLSGITILAVLSRDVLNIQHALLDLTVDSNTSKIYVDLLAANTLRVGGRSSISDDFQSVSTVSTFANNNFYCLQMSIDVANDEIKIHTDNNLSTTGTPNFSGTTFTSDIGNTSRLGATTINSRNFNGKIDEIRFLKVVLTEQAKTTYYNNLYTPATFAIAGTPENVNVAINQPTEKREGWNGWKQRGFKGRY